MRRNTTTTALAVLSATALMITTACSADGPADRAGAETLVLKMATIDGYDFGGVGGTLSGPETFATALEQVSGGKLRVDVTVGYGDGAADAESRLVEAIADGEIDGGWPASRAFAAAGIPSLGAIEAPLRLTSRVAVEALISGDAGRDALDSLDGTGVTGLALLYGGLRRPFAGKMLLTPDDWAGERMRVFGSPVQEAAVTALGAEAVQAGARWIDLVASDDLDGAEFDFEHFVLNDYGPEVGNIPLNVVLWPKVFVLSLSAQRYDSLSEEQREWVAQAVDQAVDAQGSAPSDQSYMEQMCSQGATFAMASGWQLEQLRAKLGPVVQGLRDDPATASLMTHVDAIADDNPMPETPTMPAVCTATSQVEPPDTPAGLPDGVWRVAIPVEAVAEAGVDNEGGWSGTWTLTIKDATFVLSCAALELTTKDCGNAGVSGNFEAGYLKGEGHMVFFVSDPELMSAAHICPGGPDTCMELDPYSAEWQVDGDTLTFTSHEGTHLTILPWTRIG